MVEEKKVTVGLNGFVSYDYSTGQVERASHGCGSFYPLAITRWSATMKLNSVLALGRKNVE
jgi:hypothetical protein